MKEKLSKHEWYPYNKLQRLSSELGSEYHGEDHNNNTNKNQQDDNEFLITQHEIDNETTIEEEEKLGIEMTYQEEIDLLQRENETSIEELKAMYLGRINDDDNDDNNDNSHDEDDDSDNDNQGEEDMDIKSHHLKKKMVMMNQNSNSLLNKTSSMK